MKHSSRLFNLILRSMVLAGLLVAAIPAIPASAATFTLDLVSGNDQSTAINLAFPGALQVRVRSGIFPRVATVTYTVHPAGSGAGATLSSSTANSALLTGLASVTATANGTVGSYTVTAQVTSAPSGPSTSNTVTFNLTNYDLPKVSSISRVGPSPTNATSVSFSVVFSRPVTPVTFSDFSIVTTGGQSGASIPPLGITSGDNITYLVIVNTIPDATGTIQLNLSDSDNSIKDVSNNALANPNFTGPTYTIDRVDPTVLSINRLTASPTELGTVTFVVTFSEQVTNVDNADFTLLTSVGQADASLTGSPLCIGATCTVFVNTGSANGTLELDLITSPDIVDLVGNPLAGPFPVEAYDVLVTPPIVQSIRRVGSNPTNAANVDFTVTFTQDVQGVDATDFVLTNTGTISGPLVTTVTGSGSVYTVTVNTGTGEGTIRLDLVDDDSIHDLAHPFNHRLGGLGLGNGNFNTGEYYTIDRTAPAVTSILRHNPLNSLTNASTVTFEVTFDQDVQNVDLSDFILSTTGTVTGSVNLVSPISASVYDVDVNTVAGNGTLGLSFSASNDIADLANNPLGSSPTVGTNELYTIDNLFIIVINNGVIGNPGLHILLTGNTYTSHFTSLTIMFNKDAYLGQGSNDPDSVINPLNYLLFAPGPNGIFDTTSCAQFADGNHPAEDDVQIPTGPVTYAKSIFGDSSISTVTINNGVPLPVGQYELLICGTTSITDLAGNPLGGGVDYVSTFRIRNPTSSATAPIPSTGFAPNRVTAQTPQTTSYTQSSLWLEIPRLGVKMDILGVPQSSSGNWDVSWLGANAGWLDGSAYPTSSGNSVLTGHVYDAFGNPGPFAALNTLWWGDKVIVHSGSTQYVYAVRSVLQVTPGSTASMLMHEDQPWLTLVTCRGYDEASNSYLYRVLVRAALVEVK